MKKMNEIEVIEKKELFEKVGATLGQVHLHLDEENSIMLNGSLSIDEEMLGQYLIDIKANLCDKDGKILYTLKSYSPMCSDVINYDTFSMWCREVTRFFELDELHHVEVYPAICKNSSIE